MSYFSSDIVINGLYSTAKVLWGFAYDGGALLVDKTIEYCNQWNETNLQNTETFEHPRSQKLKDSKRRKNDLEFLKKYNSRCFCCGVTLGERYTWHRGHIIAKAHGGTLNQSNLRPICVNCNIDMGTMHMYEYIYKNNLSYGMTRTFDSDVMQYIRAKSKMKNIAIKKINSLRELGVIPVELSKRFLENIEDPQKFDEIILLIEHLEKT